MSNFLWSHDELKSALSTMLLDSIPATPFAATGVCVDSRTLNPGDLFIARSGADHDGHAYIVQAQEKGAAALIIHKGENTIQDTCPVFKVTDTAQVLEALGRARRAQIAGTVIALTGSVGKTTVKEFLGHVCRTFGPTSFSVSSFNNHVGVPLSLARMPQSTAYGIFEIGMNHVGEIRPLVHQVQPHIALITTICDAHIGHLGSAEAIAHEKSEIFSSLIPGGAALVNTDDGFFELLSQKAQACGAGRILGFGTHADADIRLTLCEEDPHAWTLSAKAMVLGKEVAFRLPFLGQHRAVNALAVFGVLAACDLDLDQGAQALETVKLITGRGSAYRISLPQGDFILIDDAYNANPPSMAAAFRVLAKTPKEASGRRIAVLGMMGELGERSATCHAELAQTFEKLNFDVAFSCGEDMKYFHENLPTACQGAYAPAAEELWPIVKEAVRPGDVVLVKGSKFTRVSTIVSSFLNTQART